MRIVRALRDAGHEAYFAGGCVRDELLGIAPKDYDVATSAEPDTVVGIFPKTKVVGKIFGVVPVRSGGITVEVATFRRESGYSDRRRPDSVEFADAQADALRRDFTINALYIDPLETSDAEPGGRVIDLVGGVEDLRAGIVRAVGSPDERLKEDDLRALRAVRFAARFGFEIERGTRDAIVRHAGELVGVSRERFGDELRRMLGHSSRARAIELMHDLAIDGPVLDDGRRGDGGARLVARLPESSGWITALAGWLVERICPGASGASRAGALQAKGHACLARVRGALCLTNDEAEALRAIVRALIDLETGWLERDAAHQRRCCGAARWSTYEGACDLLRADDASLAAAVRSRREELARTPPGLDPRPLLDGGALIDAGHVPGPMFGKWLENVLDAQLRGEIETREEALALIERLRGGGA